MCNKRIIIGLGQLKLNGSIRYLSSQELPADLNRWYYQNDNYNLAPPIFSKRGSDPYEKCSSKLWLHGPPVFLDSKIMERDDFFLRCIGQSTTFNQTHAEKFKEPTENGALCNCKGCLQEHVNLMRKQVQPQKLRKIFAHSVRAENSSLDWLQIMDHLNELCLKLKAKYYYGLLSRYSLEVVVTRLARLAVTSLTCGEGKLLSSLAWGRAKQVPPSDPTFLKMGLMMLTHFSNQIHPPKALKNIKRIAGFLFSIKQPSSIQMDLIFCTNFVLVISCKSRILINRVFRHWHICSIQCGNEVHINQSSTLLHFIRTGPLSLYWTSQKASITRLLLDCSHCRRANPSSCPKPQLLLTEPLLLKALNHHASIMSEWHLDLFTSMKVKAWSGSRRVTHTISLIIGCDVVSQFLFIKTIEDGSAIAVFNGLCSLFHEYRTPKTIVSDRGSQLACLSIGNKQELLRRKGVQFNVLSSYSQFR